MKKLIALTVLICVLLAVALNASAESEEGQFIPSLLNELELGEAYWIENTITRESFAGVLYEDMKNSGNARACRIMEDALEDGCIAVGDLAGFITLIAISNTEGLFVGYDEAEGTCTYVCQEKTIKSGEEHGEMEALIHAVGEGRFIILENQNILMSIDSANKPRGYGYVELQGWQEGETRTRKYEPLMIDAAGYTIDQWCESGSMMAKFAAFFILDVLFSEDEEAQAILAAGQDRGCLGMCRSGDSLILVTVGGGHAVVFVYSPGTHQGYYRICADAAELGQEYEALLSFNDEENGIVLTMVSREKVLVEMTEIAEMLYR
ncbi:MAG: hypothetical protein ACI3V0_00615 [Faecousia sp.]